ncbi:ATP-binding protein [Pukyongiella litopenaei]|uniref:histidine kinase n=1 Tax=Pukyongiella litopenaei TaxID=2605946 RepID=A0A2S0MRB5_9RHOB|nr:ATP-binding protein [Pukyongiella litopenaei]AVO38414.1 HAMP domain-containing protein [Pukyongiella litopenaei]
MTLRDIGTAVIRNGWARLWPGPAAALRRRASPLVRRIVAVNLIGLNVMVAGMFLLDTSRASLVQLKAGALAADAELIASAYGAAGDRAGAMLAALDLPRGTDLLVLSGTGSVLGRRHGDRVAPVSPATPLNDVAAALWPAPGVTGPDRAGSPPDAIDRQLQPYLGPVLEAGTRVETGLDGIGGKVMAALAPVRLPDGSAGVLALAGPAGTVDAVSRQERERVLQMFVVALLVSVGLSLVLASTIANPLADLAEAAEAGRNTGGDPRRKGRIRLPDLGARRDEIGRLSRALRDMVSALYNRIDGNEQFAADVAHEIKNPLASLQSAVGALRRVDRPEQRERLMEVIEHDVRRLDRLVSDISNASRLDAELVREDKAEFDLLEMLDRLNRHLGQEARAAGIDFITDMPDGPIPVHGLEARLAQVFANLIANAMSFCEQGDAIRVWVRRRGDRVLAVVEDTGPGIPEGASKKIFRRFYSQRPEAHFGNNSGLGLAICKQIVEAHGGVIWAENIEPTMADIASDPLGARFVVGLPV